MWKLVALALLLIVLGAPSHPVRAQEAETIYPGGVGKVDLSPNTSASFSLAVLGGRQIMVGGLNLSDSSGFQPTITLSSPLCNGSLNPESGTSQGVVFCKPSADGLVTVQISSSGAGGRYSYAVFVEGLYNGRLKPSVSGTGFNAAGELSRRTIVTYPFTESNSLQQLTLFLRYRPSNANAAEAWMYSDGGRRICEALENPEPSNSADANCAPYDGTSVRNTYYIVVVNATDSCLNYRIRWNINGMISSSSAPNSC